MHPVKLYRRASSNSFLLQIFFGNEIIPVYIASPMSSTREKIVIIDGSGYFFRAFYAIQRLSTSKGFPTNAIYGFMNMLIRVLEVEKPTHLCVAFDPPRPSFRRERYAEYKANRDRPPEDLVAQIPHIIRSVDCFGIPKFENGRFEADDVIATLAKKAVADGYDVEIITGDKDLMQLVNPNVNLYDTMKDKRIDEAGVLEKFGVRPDQIPDFLGLMGDSSDNIPGVSGIGEKTATDLIKQFGKLEDLYARIDEVKQAKRKETLLKEKESAFLSRELATVSYEVPIECDWETLKYKGPVAPLLKSFCEEFEFHNLIKRFDLAAIEEVKAKAGKYVTISDEKALRELVARLKKAKQVCVDTETTSLSPHSARLVGISLTDKAGEGYYIPVGHHAPGREDLPLQGQIEEDTIRSLVREVLSDASIPKLGQNLKYDSQILKKWGVELKGHFDDTLLESYLINPDEPHNLDHLAQRYLGHQSITYEDVAGKGKNQVLFSEVSIEKATEYSGEDVDVTFQLHQKFVPMVKQMQVEPLYREVELPLLQVLADMEYEGICVDEKGLETMGKRLEEDLGTVQARIYELAGGPININSPKQLADLLFVKLNLAPVKKTKTGLSTDESVLRKLCSQHEICEKILKFRELMKLKSTYVDGLLGQINPSTGRIHTNFNQTVAATGRLSSSNPNLQNIPAPTKDYDVRAVFVAGEHSLLFSADYSQVELRLLADMSQDDELLRAFKSDEDVHVSTARAIFRTNEVTPEQRKVAKTINFGVVYGQTPFGLSQQLSISPSEAKAFIDAYFARYGKVRQYLNSLAEFARETGYAVTKLGRRRYIPEISSQNRMRREMAERVAINTPLQGTAADMIKTAMVRIQSQFREKDLQSRMVLQVHDELVFQVVEGEKSVVEGIVKNTMESALDLSIPLKVDVGWGKNWSEC